MEHAGESQGPILPEHFEGTEHQPEKNTQERHPSQGSSEDATCGEDCVVIVLSAIEMGGASDLMQLIHRDANSQRRRRLSGGGY